MENNAGNRLQQMHWKQLFIKYPHHIMRRHYLYHHHNKKILSPSYNDDDMTIGTYHGNNGVKIGIL